MYKIIHNEKHKVYYVVDCSTGIEIANTENIKTAKRILANLTNCLHYEGKV